MTTPAKLRAPANRAPKARREPESTRQAILKAALLEFAQEGMAGARTDHIARAAHVNKALLYYYFHDKEALYGAVLDQVFSGLAERINQVLDRDLPPREKVLAYAAAHFDYIAAAPMYPRVVQREMMRAGRKGSPHIRRMVDNYLRPVQMRLAELFGAGMEAGDFRRVDAAHFVFSIVAMNVFYFSSAPVIALLSHADPLAPEAVAARRAAVLDLIAAALFTTPQAATGGSNP
ncbi:MAG: TetR/AcrR family transcriptional regulator [Acidobacteriota bacterium]|nr:TetR/AcrR family transcriptional regulator [Acidobacteriota bacterium]